MVIYGDSWEICGTYGDLWDLTFDHQTWLENRPFINDFPIETSDSQGIFHVPLPCLIIRGNGIGKLGKICFFFWRGLSAKPRKRQLAWAESPKQSTPSGIAASHHSATWSSWTPTAICIWWYFHFFHIDAFIPLPFPGNISKFGALWLISHNPNDKWAASGHHNIYQYLISQWGTPAPKCLRHKNHKKKAGARVQLLFLYVFVCVCSAHIFVLRLILMMLASWPTFPLRTASWTCWRRGSLVVWIPLVLWSCLGDGMSQGMSC